MKYLTLTAAATALLLAPSTANAQFFGGGFDNSSVLGGLGGAGIGAGLGSVIGGSGNRTEGLAIGAALGGLAGVGFGNSQSTFAGNPYAGSFNPGFSGQGLLGTAAGAGIGGAIGSNIAGRGQRQEGTAIGAVLGGLAGYSLANRPPVNNQSFGQPNFAQPNFGPSNFGGGNFGGGNFAPASYNGGFNGGFGAPVYGGPAFGTPVFNAPQPQFNAGFAAPSFGPTFNAPFVSAPQFGTGFPSGPRNSASFVQGGFVDAGTFANTQTIYPAAPTPVFQPTFSGVTYAAPHITLAAPTRSIGSTVSQNYVTSTGVTRSPVLRRAPQQIIVVRNECQTQNAPLYCAPTAPVSYNNANVTSGESYLVTQGQPFYAPSAAQTNCANSTFGCAGSNKNHLDKKAAKKAKKKAAKEAKKNAWKNNTLHNQSPGTYSYCGSDKVYNDEGALLINSNPVCR